MVSHLRRSLNSRFAVPTTFFFVCFVYRKQFTCFFFVFFTKHLFYDFFRKTLFVKKNVFRKNIENIFRKCLSQKKNRTQFFRIFFSKWSLPARGASIQDPPCQR